MTHRGNIVPWATTLLSLVISLSLTSCQHEPTSQQNGAQSGSRSIADEAAPDPVIRKGSVRLIHLPEAKADLPAGPGRDTAMTYCGMCHTAGYITLQPPLSRETWTAEVTKMRTAFNGPIPQEKVPEIVDYLVAVRGAAVK